MSDMPDWHRLSDAHHVPFGAAYLSDARIGIDLEDYDYVEDEYVLSGPGYLYDRFEGGAPRRRPSSLEYTTRMLVRRPRRSADFSGRLHFEALHPSGDRGITWSTLQDYMIRSGHAWAGVTISNMGVSALKVHDPAAYAAISLPSDGLRWDILGQAARLLRSQDGPLAGFFPERVYASGWSYTGSLWRTFVAEGFHGAGRDVDGGSILDG
ncbi:MAG: alpha/beta hydrolase domain-containing protein, partial [Acidimicrobiales bacterium]